MIIKNKRILYIGWLGHQNLGDELMWDLFREKFMELEESKYWELVGTIGKSIRHFNVEDYDLIVLGGGSIFGKSNIDFLYSALQKGKKVIIWGSGMDHIKEEDIPSLSKGKNIELTRYYPEDKIKKLVKIIDHAEYAGVRGPLTYEFIKQMGVKEDKLLLSGDPGLLLTKKKKTHQKVVKTRDAKMIGVNWGHSNNRIYGRDEEKVENEMSLAIHQLIERGYKIYLYSVWNDDIPSLKRLYNKIGDNENVTLDTSSYHQDELLHLMDEFYFTINMKLHANVISTVADIPPISLAYRFKVFDFTHSVNMNDLTISTSCSDLKEDILRLERFIHSKREQIIMNTKEAREKYIQRINIPFNEKLYIGH